MPKLAEIMYCAVQHSAMGYKGDVAFSAALETRSLTTDAQLIKVRSNAGVVFEDYNEAEDFCDWAMYIFPKIKGLIPNSRKAGKFSRYEQDGLRIFQPYAFTYQQWDKYKAEAIASKKAGVPQCSTQH